MVWLVSGCGMVCEWAYLTSWNLSICNNHCNLLSAVDVIGVYVHVVRGCFPSLISGIVWG